MSDSRLKVTVIGAGSWGTALARVMCTEKCEVWLWEREIAVADALAADRINARYLPGYILPDNLKVTADLASAVSSANVIVIAVPSGAVASVCHQLSEYVSEGCVIISASKGLDAETGCRLSEVITSHISACAGSIVALSGPNLAVELSAGVPTASVVASTSVESARLARSVLGGPSFRLYTNSDIIGVELGGALKNVMAIGAGICEGMGFGDNTKAAFLTRGLAEMIRLGTALGAKTETFAGLSGVGDLIATSASRLSRNLRVGLALGQGKTLQDVLTEIDQVAEGVPTTKAVVSLADRMSVDMPIAKEIYAILFEGRSPSEGLTNLMSREWKDEVH